ncbi:hypothetical protein CFC21_075252 [Triticum aestivum]|uniref:Pectinesterase inhibitor domain-containing protein n=3 Tax=Triticum TaxID=4564 RepID=A0A9R1AUM3_TRITD|nr:hypothetical protein CFC21_075252 [Triticum aestivum]VAI40763.1 unnamed protein product [Triticum turgidum subsp. durum]
MVGTPTISVAMVLVVLALMSYGLPSAHADVAFISNTCKKTKNPALCEDVLSYHENSTQASTVHELASIALEIATAIAKFNSKNFGVGARYNQGTPVEDALDVCLQAYDDAIDNLKVLAKHSLHVGDYADALRKVLDAKAAGDVCDNALKRIKEDFAVESDRKMTERCGVTAELIGLLIHK